MMLINEFDKYMEPIPYPQILTFDAQSVEDLENIVQIAQSQIKYFKVTSDRLAYPAYYAAYNLADAKEVAYSDFNSQFVCDFKEVTISDIPANTIIHGAKLEYDDAKELANRAIDIRFGANA